MINRSQRKSLSILLTLALVANLFIPFVTKDVKAAAVASDLIISEYVEGSSNNKAIELFNGTGQDVNLKEYQVELYTNGGTTPNTTLDFKQDLSLGNGQTLVIVNSQANELLKSKSNMTNGIANFNGNDALVLKHNGTVIDSIGQVGFDPGKAWGTTVSTVNQTLIRKSAITTGDTNTEDAFDPSVEWEAKPGIDDFTDLGKHTMDGSPVDETKVATVTSSVTASEVAAGTEVILSTSTEGATIYYTLDGSEPTVESDRYSAPIVINEDTTIKAFAAKEGLENSDVFTKKYTVLQLKAISEVRGMQPGEYALTKGIVTAVLGSKVYIQDHNAGIVLFGRNIDVQPGDEVQAYGKVAEYNTLQELEVNPEDVQVLGQKEVPAPKELKADGLGESYEGMLVKMGKSTVESFSGGNYTAVDGSGSYQIRPGTVEWLEVDTSYESVTGVLDAYNNVYQLVPRSQADIVLDPSYVRPVKAQPGSGFVNKGDLVTLSSDTAGATIYYTTDGGEPTTSSQVYKAPIELNEDTTIKAFAAKEDMTSSKVYTFNYIIQKDVVRIHDIQGVGHFSKYEGLNVNDVEGIVTYVVDNNNFYMQDLQPDGDDKTAEGILVYKKSHGFTTGDVVKVSGGVKEYYIEGYDDRFEVDLPSTEINSFKAEKVESGHALPAPVVLGKDRIAPTEVIDNDQLKDFNPQEDGIDFYESLEGMLVQVDDAKVVAPQKYGEVVVIPGTMEANTDAGGMRITEKDYNPEKITIDMNDTKFVAKMGDQFKGSITGVMSYGYSSYRIFTKKDSLPELVEGNNVREITEIQPFEDKLTVASYNVENFSPKVDKEKVTRLAEAIVKNLKNPDIIGLTEVQDNDGPTDSGKTDASESAQLLIDTIISLGGPTYTYTDIAPEHKQDGGQPGGNIRVGFLYNKDRVKLMEGTKGTATEAVGFENGKLTLNPGRIDPTNPAFEDSRKSLAAQFEFQGESVIVVANHFNSKGGDQPLFGKHQPPVLKSEVQRMEIAKVVNGFVQDIKEKDPDANVILLGDFNDFEFSNPLKTLKGDVLVNMIEKVPAEERYSYNYQGNAQVLDHILVSKNMESTTAVDIVHINSGFMEEHGRASDHDPVLIQTRLKEAVYKKVYELKGYKAKKFVLGAPDSLVDVDSASEISEGIWLKHSATVQGSGLEHIKVVLSPAQRDTVMQLSGAKIMEVVIENNKVFEIKGAENVQKWTLKKGVDPSGIIFKDSMGNVIPSPFSQDQENSQDPAA